MEAFAIKGGIRSASLFFGASEHNNDLQLKTGPFRSFPLNSRFHKIKCSKTDQKIFVQERTMQETYDKLAHRLLTTSAAKTDKYLVGIAGPPGAGKSTLAKEVASRVNHSWRKQNSDSLHDVAIAVPMDGFHLYRHQLDAMEDPVEAYARRGAPWTFNPSGLFDCLTILIKQQYGYFPSFDHGVGDPVEQDILVTPEHRIVLVEGNYLLLDEGEWGKLRALFDERWFIYVDLDTAMRRVEKRHVSTGKTPEYAKHRVKYNDRPNAELVLSTRHHSDVTVVSVDDNI